MKQTKFLKTIAVLAATASFCMSISALPSSAATVGTREKLVEVAEKYYNQHATAATFGYKTDWCALFAHKCVNEAGGKDYSSSSSTTQTLLDYRANGKYHAKKTNDWKWNGKECPVLTQDTNYTPQVGDIALVETNNNLGDGPDHTVLVVKVEGTGINAKIYTIEGNVNGSSWATTTVGKDYWVNNVWGFCSPDYADSSVNTTQPTQTGSIYRVYDTNNIRIGAYTVKDNAYNMLKKNSSAKYMTKDNVKLTGDLDLSGAVDMTDLSYLSLYRVGDTTFEEIAKDNGIANPEVVKYNADVTGDGKVDLCDLATLRRIISKQQ